MTDDNLITQPSLKPTTDDLNVKPISSQPREDDPKPKINNNNNNNDQTSRDKESPVKIVFSMENFFNYWLTSGANAASTKPENDECNEFMKGKLVQYLMESMSQLQCDQNFTKMEPKSCMRSNIRKNSIEFNSNDPTDTNNRVS